MREKASPKTKIRYFVLAIFLCLFILCSIFMYISSRQYSLQGFACGSVVNIKTYGCINDNCQNALDEINILDSKYLSANQDSSLVYMLNAKGSVSDETGRLSDILNEYIGMSKDSDSFSLMCGELKSLWDMDGEGYLPSQDEINEILPGVNDANIKINDTDISISAGKMDLGAFGKGTACQIAIESLKKNKVKNALVTVGGSVGVMGHPYGKKIFTIGIRDPFGNEGSYFATIDITDSYISTSGDYEKYIEIDGKKYCHIFDAKTGYPKETDICSVTAVTKDGTASDFLSTAIFLSEEEEGSKLADKYGAYFIIVKKDRTVLMSKELKDSFILVDDSFTVEYI